MTATATSSTAWSRYVENGDRAAREQLILEHAPLVKYVIGRLAIYLPAVMDYEDVLSYGTLGLIQAVDRFDPSRGTKFESFAVMRIRGAILDALRSLRGLPQSVTDKARRMRDVAVQFQGDNGRQPTDAELASLLGVAPPQLDQLMQDAASATVSLDNILDNPADPRLRFLTNQRADGDVAGSLERTEAVEELTTALMALSERERYILSLYYQDELTMREIGQVLDITEGRVCQIHARCLHKLRTALALRRADDGEDAHARTG